MCELNQDAKGKTIIADGSDAEFLKILSQSLGFTYELIVTDDGHWGVQLPGGNWTGLIGKVHRKETDMSMCAIVMTESRSIAVPYSYLYDIQEYRFVTRTPRYLPKTMAFIHPFAPGLWFSVLALMLLMPFVWKGLLTKAYPMRRLFSDVFASFLYRSIHVRTLSFRDHAILGSWLFGTWFLSLSYMAVLLSFLTLPLRENLVKTIPELARAVEDGTYRVKGFKGTILLPALHGSPNPHVRLLGREIEKNAWYVRAEEEAVKSAVYESKTAVITESSFIAPFGDSVALSEDVFFPIHFGLVVRKGFCCKELLDCKLMWMTAAGLYEKCKKDFLIRSRLKRTSKVTAEEPSMSLSLEDLSGAFIILGFGYGLSIAVFAVEVCLSKN